MHGIYALCGYVVLEVDAISLCTLLVLNIGASIAQLRFNMSCLSLRRDLLCLWLWCSCLLRRGWLLCVGGRLVATLGFGHCKGRLCQGT